MELNCGLPQGSVLRPLLFIMYINDICEVSITLETILFANDTNSLCSEEDLEQLFNAVADDIKKLNIWFESNQLALNLSNTKYITWKPFNKLKQETLN